MQEALLQDQNSHLQFQANERVKTLEVVTQETETAFTFFFFVLCARGKMHLELQPPMLQNRFLGL